jgi:hypothetical protein
MCHNRFLVQVIDYVGGRIAGLGLNTLLKTKFNVKLPIILGSLYE